MSNTTLSPNMSLVVPTVSTDPGPDWANNLNASLSILDQHNHSPGSGVQITPGGLNINSDLAMNNHSLTNMKAAIFTPQPSFVTADSVYVSGVDLFFNDGNSNSVRITQGGSVAGAAGTITGLPSGTASASYQSIGGTFQFQSATNTPANLSGASVLIAQQTASPNFITLQSPNSLAAAYSVTFPTATPGTTSFLTMGTTGVLAPSISTVAGIVASNIANATITTTQISATAGILGTQIANATIATANIANGAVTVVKTTPNTLLSGSSTGGFSTGSATLVDVTNATLNTFPVLSSNGVQLLLIPVNALTSPASVEIVNGSGSPSNINATIAFLRNGTVLCEFTLAGTIVAGGSLVIPPGCCNYLDLAVTPGNYVYKVQASVTGTGGAVFVNNVILAGREIT